MALGGIIIGWINIGAILLVLLVFFAIIRAVGS